MILLLPSIIKPHLFNLSLAIILHFPITMYHYCVLFILAVLFPGTIFTNADVISASLLNPAIKSSDPSIQYAQKAKSSTLSTEPTISALYHKPRQAPTSQSTASVCSGGRTVAGADPIAANILAYNETLCSCGVINQANANTSDRWAEANAPNAIVDFNYQWSSNLSTQGLPYIQALSAYWHGPESNVYRLLIKAVSN